MAALLALRLVDGKTQVEQVRLLSAAGYAPSEIARLVGTTPATVSQTLYTLRSAKTSRGRPKQKKR